MRNRLIYIVLLFISFIFSISSFSQRKLALLIGIDDYPSTSRWQKTYAANDLLYVKKALELQGFHAIFELKEKEADRNGIMQALDRFRDSLHEGDIAVFLFAGHGQQVYDIDDQIKGLVQDEEDGFDESLVPYDALKEYGINGYKGEKHIRDDELGGKLTAIRERIREKGHLLVLLDACYNGTGTKDEGMQTVRGYKDKIAPPGYQRRMSVKEDGFLKDRGNESLLSRMVVFSASDADQLNYPTWDGETIVGTLSLNFCRALQHFREPLNYKIFFEWIKNEIENRRPSQTPLIEGADSLLVFGTGFIPVDAIILVKPINTELIVDRGSLHDIYPGMEFSLHPITAEKFDSSTQLATGKIVETNPVSAKGILNKAIKGHNLYRLVFTKKIFGDPTVNIRIIGDKLICDQLKNYLSRYKNISFTPANADLVIESIMAKGRVSIKIITPWNYVKTFAANQQLSQNILDSISAYVKQHARASYLRSLSGSGYNSSLENVSVEIVPVLAQNKYESCLKTSTAHIEKKELKLPDITKKGEYTIAPKPRGNAPFEFTGLKIKLHNRSDQKVYLTVLDIGPDNSIVSLVPYSKCQGGIYYSAEENELNIPAGDSIQTKIIGFFEPVGKEYLKIFITNSPLNLYGLQGFTKRGTVTQKESIENFLNDIIDEVNYERRFNKTRNPDAAVQTSPVKLNEIKIVSFNFRIAK